MSLRLKLRDKTDMAFHNPIAFIPNNAITVATRKPPTTPTMMPVDHIIPQKTEGAFGVIPASSYRKNNIHKKT
jgi:hypothetical protein